MLAGAFTSSAAFIDLLSCFCYFLLSFFDVVSVDFYSFFPFGSGAVSSLESYWYSVLLFAGRRL